MRHLIYLATRSAWNRRLTLGVTLAAIALSVTLLLGVERIRNDARASFAQAVSGTDLIVGARTGPVQLMLYMVYRIGEATNSISWKSFEFIAASPAVAWAVPLSLGDSHHGFAVMGTTQNYFDHFRHGDSTPLAFAAGARFEKLFDAVIGADVARRLGYKGGDKITLSHGSGEINHAEHDDKPFIITGILAPTGTPVDRTVHVSLEAMQALHLEWQAGIPIPGLNIPPELVTKFDLRPKAVTGALVGMKARGEVFRLQRQINNYKEEPLLAVLPGVALDQLWDVIGFAEKSLLAVSAMVVVVGLAGLVAVMLAGINERRRELAILRSVGARPIDIFALLTMEGVCVTLAGALLGVALLALLGGMLGSTLQSHYGLVLQTAILSIEELPLLGAVIGAGALVSLVPGYRAYKVSLADGLIPAD